MWFWLILGILIGWVAEWLLLDYLGKRSAAEADAALQEKLTMAEGQVRDLESRLQAALNREPERIVETVVKEVEVVRDKDRLQDIKGIGNVFASRLNDAGIFTFTDVAAADPQRLREIISPEEWQAIDPDGWIAQAREIAAKKSQESA